MPDLPKESVILSGLLVQLGGTMAGMLKLQSNPLD